MVYKIDQSCWYTCAICGKCIKMLAKKYGGGGIYYTEVFRKHLQQDHNITDLDYFGPPPNCHCGCNKQCTLNKKQSSNFKWKQPCGRYKGTIQWAKEAKISRIGSGNPMYGKIPWNKGLTKEISPSLKQMSIKQTGKKKSQKSKEKMSISAKKRKIHGHTGHKHTNISKEKMRQSTLTRIKNGDFPQTKTKPHIKFSEILDELDIEYIEEHIVEKWCFDFYLPKQNLYIEIDGDYFHSNPKLYPNGPVTKTQKRNWYRDMKKNEFCNLHNLKLLRFWEHEVLTMYPALKYWIEILCIQKK